LERNQEIVPSYSAGNTTGGLEEAAKFKKSK
jgi:hypothetical protein